MDNTTSSKKKSCYVESRATLTKLGIFFKICLFARDIWVLCILIERTSSEHLAKLGISVKIYLISFDAEVFFCGTCLLPGKMIVFFFILNILT